MTRYLYVKPDGFPDVSSRELPLAMFPGYVLLKKYENGEDFPNLANRRYVNGEWVWANSTPHHILQRRREYPTTQEQLAMIWKALDGIRTKPFPTEVQDMIDLMAAIDAKYPPQP